MDKDNNNKENKKRGPGRPSRQSRYTTSSKIVRHCDIPLNGKPTSFYIRQRTDPKSYHLRLMGDGYFTIKYKPKNVNILDTEHVVSELTTLAKQKIANFVFERFNGNTGAAVFGSKSRVQLVYDTEYNWMAKKNAFVYRTNVTHRSLIKPIEKVMLNAIDTVKSMEANPADMFKPKVVLSLLASFKKSSFQEVHMDFAPKFDDDVTALAKKLDYTVKHPTIAADKITDADAGIITFEKAIESYFDIAEKKDMAPLSLITAGPLGAGLVVYPSSLQDNKNCTKLAFDENHMWNNLYRDNGKRQKIDGKIYHVKKAGPIPVKLEPFETIVFRQDLYHQGIGYTDDNYRVHAYLDINDIERVVEDTRQVPVYKYQRIKKEDVDKELKGMAFTEHPKNENFFYSNPKP